ncbi:MAG TPA: hypothetical protein DCR07_06035 [Lactococcus sp.]|nr:hypothetical protein [Lactococcus sp.]
MSGIKPGQKVRFTIQQILPKIEILTGTIHQIDSAPTPLKSGNTYKVSALVTIQKTYFNYYLDKIKGESS